MRSKSGGINHKATEFMNKLNLERGWDLIGGSRSKEFSIRSRRTLTGRFYFDGFDKERMIFFEYDEPSHEYSERKENDIEKELRLIEYLKDNKLEGTLVRYNEKRNILTEKKI